jgi:predicted Zn finger-like uncharacterized protein
MIVTCPACHTRYLVDEAELGSEGRRRMRCASCGNLWHYSPVVAAIQSAVAEATAEIEAAAHATHPAPASPYAPIAAGAAPAAPIIRPEPGTQSPATMSAAPPPPPVTPPQAGRAARGGGRVAALVSVLLILALALTLVVARDEIIARLPTAAALYDQLRLNHAPGRRLEITKTVERFPGSIIVAGTVVNNTEQPQRVARLRVTLLDAGNSGLETHIIDPPAAELAPGGAMPYQTRFDNPSNAAVAVDIAFAE